MTPTPSRVGKNMQVRRNLDLEDIRLSWLEWNISGGEGEKLGTASRERERLLLLHGLGDHALVWSSLGEYLGGKYHIVAPDLRGHGESSKPEQGYTFGETIADLEALMNHLGWQDAHILGHSWAAKLIAIWAQQQPQRFRSAILVDPIFIMKMPSIVKLSFPILYRTLETCKGMGPFPSYEAAKSEASKLGKYAGWSELQQTVFQGGIEEKPNGSWGSKFSVAARNGIFEEVTRVAGLTKPIHIRTLFIQPEKGVNRTELQLKPYKSYLTDLTVKGVPGNHWPFLVEPDIFNRSVAAFLAAQPG